MALSFSEIADIVKLIDSSSCEELVIELPDLKLVIRRHGASGNPSHAAQEAPDAQDAPPSRHRAARGDEALRGSDASTQPGSVGADKRSAEAVPQGDGLVEVKAPMVGTFYRAPAPDQPPFVEVGSIVKEGDPVCLIEVMKLFTTIFAPCAGKVEEVGAENGTMVEYGQVLFVLEPE